MTIYTPEEIKFKIKKVDKYLSRMNGFAAVFYKKQLYSFDELELNILMGLLKNKSLKNKDDEVELITSTLKCLGDDYTKAYVSTTPRRELYTQKTLLKYGVIQVVDIADLEYDGYQSEMVPKISDHILGNGFFHIGKCTVLEALDNTKLHVIKNDNYYVINPLGEIREDKYMHEFTYCIYQYLSYHGEKEFEFCDKLSNNKEKIMRMLPIICEAYNISKKEFGHKILNNFAWGNASTDPNKIRCMTQITKDKCLLLAELCKDYSSKPEAQTLDTIMSVCGCADNDVLGQDLARMVFNYAMANTDDIHAVPLPDCLEI